MSTDKKFILLVEDDCNLGFVIQDTLKMHGFKVTLCTDGNEGLKVFNEKIFDLCLLDVMLPKKDGFSLAEDIRKLNPTIPIVFLTAKSMVEDKIKGLKIGADDYITKPFSNEELLLRIQAIIKRNSDSTLYQNEQIYILGKYEYNSTNYQLSGLTGVKVLTRKEGELLKLLCKHANTVIDRKLITTTVWGNDDYFIGRSLDVFISKLRKYLSEDTSVLIKNVHGVGFMLELKS